ncbi:MAG: endolytic transglycosylase MltG [Candidatus Kerfeldbacteria bacterium]
MSAARAVIGVIAGGIIAITIVGVWGLSAVYIPASQQEIAVEVTIENGIGLNGVVQTFDELGMVRSPFWFKAYAFVSGQANDLQAGDYVIAGNSSAADIVDVMAQGIILGREVTVTTIEGWDSTEVYDELITAGLRIDPDEFEQLTGSGYIGDSSMAIYGGKPASAGLEGYLFPDTYELYRDAPTEEILQKMVDNFESRITPDMERRVAASGMTFYKVLTLASILEKELRTPEERRIGAGIFLKRLEDSYPLESDATVNYVTGKNTTRPSLDDLAVQSRYNTYTHPGLPPGPICNPGLDAINAVLNPTETDYYFFLTTPEGDAVFTETFDEHLEQKNKYYSD